MGAAPEKPPTSNLIESIAKAIQLTLTWLFLYVVKITCYKVLIGFLSGLITEGS